jgi:hypothetical protein
MEEGAKSLLELCTAFRGVTPYRLTKECRKLLPHYMESRTKCLSVTSKNGGKKLI